MKEMEAGAKAAGLSRKHSVLKATLYNWKPRYGGIDVSEARRLRALEDGNAKLKKLLAEAMLDIAALRELLSPKWLGARRSRIYRPSWICQSTWPARLSGRIRRWSGIAHAVHLRRSCTYVCAILPMNGVGSAIVACSSCYETKGWFQV